MDCGVGLYSERLAASIESAIDSINVSFERGRGPSYLNADFSISDVMSGTGFPSLSFDISCNFSALL